MAKRSLKASETGIKQAKQAFRRTGWTQEYLASAVGLETRQSIWKFFSGRPIERHLFIDVCFQLNLEWEDIVAPPDEDEDELIASASPSPPDPDLQAVRSPIQSLITTQGQLLQVSLDTASPLAIEQVYTHVQVLVTPNSQRWLEVANFQVEAQDRQARTPGATDSCFAITDLLQPGHKLMILGKPGSGKTTLLQHLALQCAGGHLYVDHLPVFISLRTYAATARGREDYSLTQQIVDQWSAIGLPPTQIHGLLQTGKVFVLLDGLDEVSAQESSPVSYQIQQFAEAFPQSTILITCRLAAQEYQFRGFTYVELSDFDPNQIAIVARKWFIAMSQGHQHSAKLPLAGDDTRAADQQAQVASIGVAKAEQFLHHLDRPENAPIREMITTPLLLHLACLVFYERAMFPTKRAKLYQAGLDILLVRWDKVRGIERDLGRGNLSLPETMNLLSQIAFLLFAQGKTYFEKSDVLAIISEFLQSRSLEPLDPEELWLTSETVLRAIVMQSGLLVERARDIYSFSHLTFQEYLTARKLTARCLHEGLEVMQEVACHMADPRWSEVILLTLSLLPKPDPLLHFMSQEVNALVQTSSPLQQALAWVNQKTAMAPQTYKAAAVRAFYLPLWYNQDISLAIALDDTLAFDLEPQLALDLAIARTYQMIQNLGEQPTSEQILELWFSLDFGRQFPQETSLNQALIELKSQLPNLDTDELVWQTWWQVHQATWRQQFQETVLQPQKMDFGWALNPVQQQQLWEYYRTTQFFVNCLSSDCHLDPAVRSQIEMTLLSHQLTTVSGSPTIKTQR